MKVTVYPCKDNDIFNIAVQEDGVATAWGSNISQDEWEEYYKKYPWVHLKEPAHWSEDFKAQIDKENPLFSFDVDTKGD